VTGYNRHTAGLRRVKATDYFLFDAAEKARAKTI